MKTLTFFFVLVTASLSALNAPATIYHVLPPDSVSQTTLAGKNWHYTVPFAVQNKSTIEKLIQCESRGVNIARPDSNGLTSWGILQFNGTSTWKQAEAKFRFTGSPMIPADAIHMADLMISAGEVGLWTCAHVKGLIK